MGNENSRISGESLATLMGVDAETYRTANIPRFGHSFLHPSEILTEAKVVEGFPEGVQRATDGKYKSGEVWMDTFYEVMYLYIGKTPEGKDLAIELGGDTPYAGRLEQGVVNSGDEGRIFFDRKLFP